MLKAYLPIATYRESGKMRNETICEINELLRDFCMKSGFTYIDLHKEMIDDK